MNVGGPMHHVIKNRVSCNVERSCSYLTVSGHLNYLGNTWYLIHDDVGLGKHAFICPTLHNHPGDSGSCFRTCRDHSTWKTVPDIHNALTGKKLDRVFVRLLSGLSSWTIIKPIQQHWPLIGGLLHVAVRRWAYRRMSKSTYAYNMICYCCFARSILHFVPHVTVTTLSSIARYISTSHYTHSLCGTNHAVELESSRQSAYLCHTHHTGIGTASLSASGRKWSRLRLSELYQYSRGHVQWPGLREAMQHGRVAALVYDRLVSRICSRSLAKFNHIPSGPPSTYLPNFTKVHASLLEYLLTNTQTNMDQNTTPSTTCGGSKKVTIHGRAKY